MERMEQGSCQWCRVPGQEAVTQTGGQVLSTYQAALLCCVGDEALAQVHGEVVRLGDLQRSLGHGPG